MILVLMSNSTETKFHRCQKGEQLAALNLRDETGKDLHVVNPRFTIETHKVKFLHSIFAITEVSFHRSVSWGSLVYCLCTQGFPNDNASDELASSKTFRFHVQKHLRPPQPKNDIKRFSMGLSDLSFHAIFGALKPKRHVRNLLISKWTYLPAAGDKPTNAESDFVQMAAGVSPTKAHAICKQAKNTRIPIFLGYGPSTLLQARKKKVCTKYPEGTKSTIQPIRRAKEVLHHTKLMIADIKELEEKIGHFTSKCARGSVVPTRFIEARKQTDPVHVKDCQMQITFSEEKRQLTCGFNFIIKKESGQI